MKGKAKCCGCIKSQAQIDVTNFIETFGHKLITDRYTIIPPLQLDIYIPSLKIAIEYCGLYWHGELLNKKTARNKHLIKYNMCKEKGIRLITLFANEWIYRNEQTKGFLSAILGPRRRVFARNCKIKEVSPTESFDFTEKYHVLEGVKLSGVGLYEGDELTALGVFKKANKSKGTGLELVRYVNKTGTTVVGGLSKILAHVKTNEPVITYSDNRWSSGNLYEKIGFTKNKESKPSYWYFEKSTDGPLFHRFKFRKSRLLDLKEGETEKEYMFRNGFDRIWDCGKIKWILS
jgi:hypothetical protein